mgnify:CR=1 FL=1
MRTAHLARAAHAVDEHAARESLRFLWQQQQLHELGLHRPLEQRVQGEMGESRRYLCQHGVRLGARGLEELLEAGPLDHGPQHAVALVSAPAEGQGLVVIEQLLQVMGRFLMGRTEVKAAVPGVALVLRWLDNNGQQKYHTHI